MRSSESGRISYALISAATAELLALFCFFSIWHHLFRIFSSHLHFVRTARKNALAQTRGIIIPLLLPRVNKTFLKAELLSPGHSPANIGMPALAVDKAKIYAYDMVRPQLRVRSGGAPGHGRESRALPGFKTAALPGP